MRRSLLVLSSFAIALGVAGGAFAQDSTDTSESNRIQRLVQPSIVFIKTTWSASVRNTQPDFRAPLFDGEPVSVDTRCTGFFVNPDGYVATAAHCLLADEEIKELIVRVAADQAFEEGLFTDDTTLDDARSYGAEWFKTGRVTASYVVSYPQESPSISSEETTSARRVAYRSFDEGDIGLLKFETRGIEMPGLELAETADVQVGTRIVAIGFPGSVDEVTDEDYTPGFESDEISKIATRGGGQVAVYQHGAAVSGGMSGGPVVDTDGRVIGVTSFGIVGETAAFNFATPVSILQEVLGDKDVDNVFGTVGELYREGVEALHDGDRSKAIDRFDEVLTFQGNPAVAVVNGLQLRQEAAALPEDGFPWWILAVIAAALVVAVAAGVLLLRRRGAAPVAVPAYAGVPSTAPPSPAALPPAAPAATTRSEDMVPTLVLVAPRGETAERHRLEGEMSIGREGTDILLDDEEVSRRHATIRVADGKVELTDLGSANGTEVNGQTLTATVALGHGDTITVGRTSLRLELPPSMRGPGPSDATVMRR